MTHQNQIRQPIVTVCGHVDHGKTSLLDRFRGSSIQSGEAGGITQKISFTKYPLEKLKDSCPLLEQNKIKLEIPGFLFIDTPGHAAFTSLRKRGGSLADLAILVISIKEGIKPQTAEVLQILKHNKTPFLIALNKIDNISGWKNKENLKDSIENQAINVRQEFEEALLTFQASLSEHGFESDLYYELKDFTKKIAIVPCSAKTGEGISELLFVLSGLCEKFFKEQLKISENTRGVILEVKKDKSLDCTEAILYDGILKENDEIAIASFGEIIFSKIRAIEEIEPLSSKYKSVKSAKASTGLKIHLTKKENILSGMPFIKLTKDNLEKIKEEFKKEISEAIQCDNEGIIIKADSLGSLEAMKYLLKEKNVKIIKAGIGPINKSDIISAKANLDINVLNAVVLGFNVISEEDSGKEIKIISGNIIYKIIEDFLIWREKKLSQIEREKMMSLANLCKLEILPKYIFRNSNPAIFGVKVFGGKAKANITLINETGETIARVKSLQLEKEKVEEAPEGSELAIALPGVAFDRKLKDTKYLYSDITSRQFKEFKKNKELLSSSELKILQEIADIKRKKDENWGE